MPAGESAGSEKLAGLGVLVAEQSLLQTHPGIPGNEEQA